MTRGLKMDFGMEAIRDSAYKMFAASERAEKTETSSEGMSPLPVEAIAKVGEKAVEGILGVVKETVTVAKKAKE
jgi:hypothetical protein